MRHRKKTFKIGRRRDHVKALLANQVSSLILEERIKTTVTKAKETRRLAEKVVTLGKKGTLHHRRLAISRLGNKEAVSKLFSDIAPRYLSRAGGYTRIIRLGTQTGDAADVCLLEWVETEQVPRQKREPATESAEEAVVEGAAEAAPEVETEEAAEIEAAPDQDAVVEAEDEDAAPAADVEEEPPTVEEVTAEQPAEEAAGEPEEEVPAEEAADDEEQDKK